MLRAFACAPSPSQRRALFVVAATNRPELIDAAMLRPGRLDKLLYVPLPTPDERASILSALARRAAIASGVDLGAVARDKRADGFSGADLAALLREVSLRATIRALSAADFVRACHRRAWL